MLFRSARFWNATYGLLGVSAIAFLATTGCLHAPQVERTRYYTVTPEITVEPVSTTSWTLGVRPLFASRTYGAPMAYLDDNFQVGYMQRDEWAEPPANVVTRAINDSLAATRRFADVGNAADMARPDLLLTGELRSYHENRTVEPHVAELEVRLELRPAVEPGSIWAETIKEVEPMAGDAPQDFAKAMNVAVARFAREIAERIGNVPLPDKNNAVQGFEDKP